MKKMITLLLVVVMLVSCMATTVFAAKAGEEVTVQFVTSGNPGFGSYNATISYDTSVLELVKFTEGSLSAGKGIFTGNAKTATTGYMGLTDVTGDGVLFTATFKVLEAAEKGKSYDVTAALVANSASNIAGEYVAFEIIGGAVVIDECTHTWGAWTETKPASCTEPGEETRICSECNKPETRPITAPGHSLKWEHDDDYHWQECQKCDYATPKAEHAYDNDGNCVCGAKKLDNQPDTGDYATPVITFTVVAMIGLLAAAAYVTKRKFAK